MFFFRSATILSAMLLLGAPCLASGPQVVTEPLQRYGSGRLNTAEIAPNSPLVALGGNLGVALYDYEEERVVRYLGEPGYDVTAMAWAPDETTYATVGSVEQSIRLWNTALGTEVGRLPTTGTQLSFSPDGTRLAVAAGNSAEVWNVETRQRSRSIPMGGQTNSVAWKPDGSSLLVTSAAGTRIVNPATGLSTQTFGPMSSGAFSSSGRYLALSSNEVSGLLAEWQGTEYVGEPSGIAGFGVAFATDESYLVTRLGEKTFANTTAGGHQIGVPTWHPDMVLGHGFTADGKVISVSSSMVFIAPPVAFRTAPIAFTQSGELAISGDGRFAAWVVGSEPGLLIQDLQQNVGPIALDSLVPSEADLEFFPDSDGLAYGYSFAGVTYVMVRSASTGLAITSHNFGGMLGRLATSPDAVTLGFMRQDGAVTLWNRVSGQSINIPPPNQSSEGYGIGFSRDGSYVYVDTSENLSIRSTVTGDQLRSFAKMRRESSVVGFLAEPHTILCRDTYFENAATANLVILDWQSGQTLREYPNDFRIERISEDGGRFAGNGAIWSADDPYRPIYRVDATRRNICLTNDGRTVVYADLTDRIKSVLVDDPERRTIDLESLGTIFGFAFSPSGDQTTILSKMPWNENIISSYDVQSGTRLGKVSLPFVPDLVALLSDVELVAATVHNAQIWDLFPTPSLRTSLDVSTQHTNTLTMVDVDAARQRLLSIDNSGLAIVWDLQTKTPLSAIAPEASGFVYGRISPDGTLVAICPMNGPTELFNATNGEKVGEFATSGQAYSIPEFSKDSTRLVTSHFAGLQGAIVVWNVATRERISTSSPDFPPSPAQRVFLSPDNRKLAAITGAGLALWDAVAGGAPIRRFGAQSPGLFAPVAFSPDSSRLIAGNNGFAQLWDTGPLPEGPVDPPTSNRTKDKLIIVAGGGPYDGNAIAAQTEGLANTAFAVATLRGYSAANTLYLSAFEATDRVDGPATAAALREGIRTFGADARRLTIMLFDHGERDVATGEWFFLLDGTQSPRELLRASDLRGWLDEAQSGVDPLTDVIVLTEMCFAGGLTETASAPLAPGLSRILVASAAKDRLAAIGGPDGSLSFSAAFLSSLLQGNTFDAAFRSGQAFVAAIAAEGQLPQLPQLDDNGDATMTLADGAQARRHVFGSVPAFGALPPQILQTRPDALLATAENLTLWLETGSGGTASATAYVSFDGAPRSPDAPISGFTTLPLTREGTTSRWSATLPADALPYRGSYTVVYVATNQDPLQPALRLPSAPAAGRIVVEEGPTPTPTPTPTPSPSPSPSPTATVSPTPEVTVTVTPTASPTASETSILDALLGNTGTLAADSNGDEVLDAADLVR